MIPSEAALNEARKPRTARSWVFTVNNYEELPDLTPTEENKIVYAVYSEERGENGTPHLQGMCKFKSPVRLTHLKAMHPVLARAHVEVMRGTPDQARAYCMKTGNPNYEFGTWDYPFYSISFRSLV